MSFYGGVLLAVEKEWQLWDNQGVTREDLLNLVRRLPEEKLPKVEEFLRNLGEAGPPYKPVPLGGILAGYVFTEADIAEARKEMWASFGERF